MTSSTSTNVTVSLGRDGTRILNTISDVLPYAQRLTGIDVKSTGFLFTSSHFLDVLRTPMPHLTSISFHVVPGGSPQSDLIFEYSPQRFPALTSLSLNGIGLRCATLGNLVTLELRDFPQQPATIALSRFLHFLDASPHLRQLTLVNYLSMAHNDKVPRHLPVRMRALKELCIEDTPQQTALLLHQLHQLPSKTTIGGFFGDTRFERQPSNFNAFLSMLPSGRPDLYYPVLNDSTTAKLDCSEEDTIRLVCKGRQGELRLEVNSTLRHRRDTPPAIYGASYSAAVASAGAILALARPLHTLECTGTPIGVEHRALVNVFLGTVGLLQLTIVEPGPGHSVRALLEAITSVPEGALQAHRVLCPHLEGLALRQTTYAPAVVDVVLQALRCRHEMGARVKRLELALQAQVVPKGKDRYGQPMYDFVGASNKGWENMLLRYVDTVQITDL